MLGMLCDDVYFDVVLWIGVGVVFEDVDWVCLDEFGGYIEEVVECFWFDWFVYCVLVD